MPPLKFYPHLTIALISLFINLFEIMQLNVPSLANSNPYGTLVFGLCQKIPDP